MKDLSLYIKDTIITESFQCSILNDIKKQIDEMIDKVRKENEEIKKEYADKGEELPSWRLNSTKYYLNNVLKDIPISWDKIKDEDFTVYTDIEKAIELGKRMVANRKNKFWGLIIPVEDLNKYYSKSEKRKYHGLLYARHYDGRYFSLIDRYGYGFGRDSIVKPKDIEGFMKYAEKVYVLNLSEHQELITDKKQLDRRNAKSHMVVNEKWYYDNLAKENRERYKKLAAKIKQEKYADDGIAEKIQTYVLRSLKFTEEFSKNPLKYSSYQYEIGNFVETCSKVISQYSEYLKEKLSLASGHSYDWDRKNFEVNKKNISTLCKNLDTLLEKIEDKINAAA